MIWPIRAEIWPDINKAYEVYANIANAISEHESVKLILPQENIKSAKKYLSSAIKMIDYQCDDSWARDSMPIFVNENKKLKALNFQFNAWGEKFSPFDSDQKLKTFLNKEEKWSFEEISLVLEGGSIHSNGNGTLLTTKECLLNPNRNPTLSENDIKEILNRHLNIKHHLWLPYGIDGDCDTDGHIDNVACFVDENSILIQSCHDKSDLNYQRHQKNMAYLKAHGTDFNIIEINQPNKQTFQNNRLALSYLNFYFCNHGIIMPSFNDKKADSNAKAILAELFPRKTIHQIHALDLLVGGGGIHCITMQQPDIH
jgi:agmatine deiminase